MAYTCFFGMVALGFGDGFGGSGNAADLGVELAGLVELLDIVLAFEIVAVEFGDEQAAVGVPAQAGGLLDKGFGGKKLKVETLWEADLRGGLLRGKRGRGVGGDGDWGEAGRGEQIKW